MKKSLLFAASLAASLTCNAFAQASFQQYDYVKNPLNITVVIYHVKSHSPSITDEQCQFQVKESYQFYTNKMKYDLGDTMYIRMMNVYHLQENGINIIKGLGVWHGISPTDGKPFADPTYFYGVGLVGSGEIIGVLRDDYCQAQFKGSLTNAAST